MLAQYIAVFIAAYFIVHFPLVWLVPERFNGGTADEPARVLRANMRSRFILSAVAVLVLFLWRT